MPDIDWAFIEEREGKAVLTGYVPTKADGTILGKSGVTVGSGVDLGQMNEYEINHLDISTDLKTKLKPFALKKLADATKALEDYKTTNKADFALTEAEVTELDIAMRKKQVKTLTSAYNKAVAAKTTTLQFEQLPSGIQTAIASLGFQYGMSMASHSNSSVKDFWTNVTDQDWEAAATKLENFGDVYTTRRKLEAEKLRAGIKDLPVPAAPAATPAASP